MPENDGELMISAHIAENGGVKYAIGQQLTLEIGDRVAQDGEVLVGNLSYDTEEPEDFRVRQTKTYTVVGICARPSTEEYSAGGYSVFTRLDSRLSGRGRPGDHQLDAEPPEKRVRFHERV